MALPAMASSCSSKDEPDVQMLDNLYVSLRVATATTAAQSRSGVPAAAEDDTWADDYPSADPDSYENQLLADRLLVTFYNAASGQYLGRLTQLENVDFVTASDGGVHEIRGLLTPADQSVTLEQLRGMSVKVMVWANAPTTNLAADALTAGLSGDAAGMGAWQYQFPSDGSYLLAIPLWGVATTSLSGITPGTSWSLGQVDLMRALAKVEVAVNRADASLDNVSVTAVTVSRINTSGLVAPGRWNSIAATSALKFSETLRVPQDVASAQNVKYDHATDDGAVILYLPECANTAADEIVLRVDYTVGSVARSNDIYLRPYTDGRPAADGSLWDVVRNHHYRYEITSVNSIRFTATVHDWTVVERSFVM